MLLSTFLAAWLFLYLAPDTSIGRIFRRVMVEMPAALLCKVKRGHLLLTGGLLTVGALAIHFGGGDAVVMIRLMSPELTSFLITVDVATYVDVLFALAVAASAVPMRRGISMFVTLRPRRQKSQARARSRRSGSNKSPQNDNEAHPVRAAA